jgi:hypothetical protein
VAQPLVDAAEAAARVRAALAYAGVTVKAAPTYADLASTGLTYATLTRIVSPTDPRGADIELLWAIADACNVPRRFMEEGFAGLAETGLADRMAELEREMAELRRLVGGDEGNPRRRPA